jgi:tRNA (mo5U34)-methyltransferase
VTKTWSFDSELTQSYTRVRQAFIAEFLDSIRGQISLQSAVDVGCGVGYFSEFLRQRGFQVVAVDGRQENAKEGRRRHPEITFLTKDAEDPSLPEVGVFDFVLCVGLLYHLENPFRAIRNLHALTGKVLVIESMCAPGKDPSLVLLDEGQEHDQGLNYVAFYPTESCLVKMLYRAGFPFVFGCSSFPNDEFFRNTLWYQKRRTFLVAAKCKLDASRLALLQEPRRPWDIWQTPIERARGMVRRLASRI